MANQTAKIDDNRHKTLMGVTDDGNSEIRNLLVDPTTGRLKVSAVISGASSSKVAVDSAASPDYIGAASTDGVLRTSAPLTYTDGGNYVTLALDQTAIDHDVLTNTHNLTTDIDHGNITGIADDDHTQYHTDARGDLRYYTQTLLGSTSNAEGASLIGIEDAGTYFTGTTVEAALQELGAAGGAATSPGGLDTNVQINDGGSFGGEATFTYNKTTDLLTLTNALSTSNPVIDLVYSGATKSTLSIKSDGSLGVSSVGDVDIVADSTTVAEFSGTSAFLKIENNATYSPLNLTERSAAPTTPTAGDIYLDDGTGTTNGTPAFMRYTGSGWEEIGAQSSGGKTYWDAIIATSGGDYTTLGAAIAAGATRIFVREGTYTETGAIALPANCTIVGESKNAIIDLVTYTVTTATDTNIERVTIKSAVDNGNAIVIGGDDNMFSNCVFQFTNASNPGGQSNFISDNNTARDRITIKECSCIFSGNFSNQRIILQDATTSDNWIIDNIMVSGATSGAKIMKIDGGDQIISNISATGLTTAGSIEITAIGSCMLSNLSEVVLTISGSDIMVSNSSLRSGSIFSGATVKISNCDLNNITLSGDRPTVTNCTIGTITFGSGADKARLTNCEITGAITFDTGATDQSFIGCIFAGGSLAMNGNSTYSDCSFGSGFTVASTVTNVAITNCQTDSNVSIAGDRIVMHGGKVGLSGGGGAVTITVTADANNTVLNYVLVDAAISDSGTGTVNNSITY